jgi:hypothetical protein
MEMNKAKKAQMMAEMAVLAEKAQRARSRPALRPSPLR